MGLEKPTYEELEARLAEAEGALKSIRNGEIDTVLGNNGIYYLHLKALEKDLSRSLKQIEKRDFTLDTLMKCVPEGITIAEAPDVNIVRVSDYGKELLGKPGKTLEGVSMDKHVMIWDIYESDGNKKAKNEDLPLTRAVCRGETVKDEEWVLGKTDGSRIPMLCNAAPILNREGKIIGGIIAWKDISRQKKIEEAFRRMNETLEQRVSERTASLEAKTILLEKLNKKMAAEIQQRKQLERELKKNEERLSLAIQATGAGIYEHNVPIDSDTFHSEQWANIIGYTKDELPRPESFLEWLDTLIHPEDQPKLYLSYEDFIEGRSEYDVEVRMKHKSGKWIFVRCISRATARDEAGRAKRIVGVMIDITKQKKIEEALKFSNRKIRMQYDRRKFLSQTLVMLLERDRSEISMALHDHAGQVLTSLKMDLELIKKELSVGTTADKVKSSEKKVGDLLDFIRNVSRDLRPGSLDKIGLIPCIKNLMDNIKEYSKIDTKFFAKGIPERLHPDKALALYRIVQESLNNITKHAHADEAFVNIILRDGTIHLSVEDNGTGFDCRKTNRIINSRKGPLGLNIMKERALQVGGKLWFESIKGKGSTILAEIPLNEQTMGSDADLA